MGKIRGKKVRLPGVIIMIVLVLLLAELIGLLAVTKMVPVYILMAAALVLILFVALAAVLVQDARRKGPFAVGTLLAILLGVIVVLGNIYIFVTYNTLTKISGVSTMKSQIGVYVRIDDPAQTINDTKDYNFGILDSLDQENTTEAIQKINDAVGADIQTTQVSGVMELVDGLLKGNYDAVILNHAYLPVLEDMDEYADLEDKIREVEMFDVLKTEEQKTEEAKREEEKHIIRLYISGIDTRGSAIINTRSDVNIIATLNTETKQMLLVSTPRDYFVPLSISNGEPDKLTHAGIYGVNVSMDTLGMLYDINLNTYFRVNFAGFVKIIDALGGITVHSDYTFTSGNYSFTEGDNTLNGEEALVFARTRYAFAEGDRQRGKDQMEVIKAVMKKAMSPQFLENYLDIMSSVDGCFETNMSYDKIAELVRDQLSGGGEWNVVSYSVDGTGDNQKPYSMSAHAYVMIPDMTTVDQAKMLMQKVVDGEVLEQQ